VGKKHDAKRDAEKRGAKRGSLVVDFH
jgi:hypothetical protein